MARAADKSIVAVKLGQSEAGRSAAMAHTGSLAGSVEAFDAIAGEVGVIRADTLDDAVEITELLVHTGARRVAGSAPSRCPARIAACSSMSAERNGLAFPALAPATTERLNAVLTVGSLVANPIDGGLRGAEQRRQLHGLHRRAAGRSRTWTWCCCRKALPRGAGLRSRRALHSCWSTTTPRPSATKPIAFVTPISHGQTDYSRALRANAGHVSFLQEAYKALRADRERRAPRRARAPGARRDPVEARAPTPERYALIERLRGRARRQHRPRSTKRNPRSCCAPTASPRRRKRW